MRRKANDLLIARLNRKVLFVRFEDTTHHNENTDSAEAAYFGNVISVSFPNATRQIIGDEECYTTFYVRLYAIDKDGCYDLLEYKPFGQDFSTFTELSGSIVEQEVTHLGRNFKAYQCDFSDRNSVYNFIEQVKRENQSVDILFNNAGTILRKPAAEHPDKYWDEVIDVNLNAQFIISREFGKEMVKNGGGKIIFTASLLTFQGGINVPGYAASKGAIGSLTKALANEWASKGVNVNAIAPGYIRTDNTKAIRNDPDRSVSALSRIPVGRWGTPDDFKGVALFLASAASDYVHGTIITVDGGWMGR